VRLGNFLLGTIAASAGLVLYGALFETDRLRRERRALRLPGWPAEKDGYRVGLVADPHVRDGETVRLTRETLEFLLSEDPDVVAFAGDTVAYWKPGVEGMLREALAPLRGSGVPSVAVPGNHDYFGGGPERLLDVFEEHGIRLLRNEALQIAGVNWVGVDSAGEGYADPYTALRQCDPADPTIVLWHEPDMVDHLPRGPELMLSGHSHGGQFCAPWGWAPMKSRLGEKYVRGFYPDAPVPIYVSRGLGTTGPPSRLFCPPEATLLVIGPDPTGP
jgi:predicted MPP superfamily phosphohydrolase